MILLQGRTLKREKGGRKEPFVGQLTENLLTMWLRQVDNP